MFALVVAATVASAAPVSSPRVFPDRQAQAVVTIVRAVTIRDGEPVPENGVIRTAMVRDSGDRKTVRLVEFY